MGCWRSKLWYGEGWRGIREKRRLFGDKMLRNNYLKSRTALWSGDGWSRFPGWEEGGVKSPPKGFRSIILENFYHHLDLLYTVLFYILQKSKISWHWFTLYTASKWNFCFAIPLKNLISGNQMISNSKEQTLLIGPSRQTHDTWKFSSSICCVCLSCIIYQWVM